MARFINPIGSNRRTVTPGERRFGQRLKDLLEDDYLCWHDVPIGPLRQYPDFIVLHPSRGFLVLEVKDWKIETIKSLDKHSAEIITDSGLKTVANPLEQARSYA